MKYKILIFIITYKASFRVIDVIKKIPFKYLKKYHYQLYISDDCSNDDTVTFINKIKSKFKKKLSININKKNLGYGANIKKCLHYAYKNKFTHAAMLHGDNQYSAKYLKKMIENIAKHNFAAVSGTRMKNKKSALKGGMPLYKFIGNIFLTKCFNFIYRTNFTDCHTGYWLYNLNKINKNILQKCNNGFLFDLDMRLKLITNNLCIKEIPIITHYGDERSSFHLNYALMFFIKIFYYKIFNEK